MNSKKTNPSSPLERLEDALVDTILNMSESELDAELREMNLDPNDVAIRTKAAINRGIVAANKASLTRAKNQLAEAKGRLAIFTTLRDRAGALERFEKMKAGDTEPMMMAARKGEGLSEKDIEGVLEDLDDLEKLEKGDDQE